MSWHRETLDTKIAHLVATCSPQLLAAQLQSACADYLRVCELHQADLARATEVRSEAERIGRAVMSASRAGRKTVRIADLIGAASPTTTGQPDQPRETEVVDLVAALRASVEAAKARRAKAEAAKVPHDHDSFRPGCYRCELDLDEIGGVQ